MSSWRERRASESGVDTRNPCHLAAQPDDTISLATVRLSHQAIQLARYELTETFPLRIRYQSRCRARCKSQANGSDEGGLDEEFMAFTEIVRKYIMDGAPDEINLRYVLRTCVQFASFRSGGSAFPPCLFSPWTEDLLVVYTPSRGSVCDHVTTSI